MVQKRLAAWMPLTRVLLFLLLLLIVGCDRTSPSQPTPPKPGVNTAAGPAAQPAATPVAATQPAPASLPQLDLQGLRQIITETKARQQVLVIDFWATWCVPCVEMFPALHDGVKTFGPRARIISVTL